MEFVLFIGDKMVKLASKNLLLSWSNALDIVGCWNYSFTKQNAQLHVCSLNHNRSCECTHDGMFLNFDSVLKV
jgi:hypothetical protein